MTSETTRRLRSTLAGDCYSCASLLWNSTPQLMPATKAQPPSRFRPLLSSPNALATVNLDHQRAPEKKQNPYDCRVCRKRERLPSSGCIESDPARDLPFP
jgi:hypothetical protein